MAAARGRADLCDAVAEVHGRLQAEIDRRRPMCSASGRCCRFEAYGHRLFVTTIELAVFADRLSAAGSSADASDADTQLWDGSGCPYQIDGLCGVHGVRPFGCRVYFCDPSSTDWQQDLYERTHNELKALHERAQVAYYYVEWREALQAMGLTRRGTEAGTGTGRRSAGPSESVVVPLRVTHFLRRTQD